MILNSHSIAKYFNAATESPEHAVSLNRYGYIMQVSCSKFFICRYPKWCIKYNYSQKLFPQKNENFFMGQYQWSI